MDYKVGDEILINQMGEMNDAIIESIKNRFGGIEYYVRLNSGKMTIITANQILSLRKD